MTEQTLNEDSTIGLLRVLSLFANPVQQQGTAEDSNAYFSVNPTQRLSREELNNIFRQSFLARKIIEKYPAEAKVLGFILTDQKGGEISINDVYEKLLDFVYEGSVWGRLYGIAFVVFNYEFTLPSQPLRPQEKLVSYSVELDLIPEGEYFVRGDVRYHQS